jgi:hypothetical protein
MKPLAAAAAALALTATAPSDAGSLYFGANPPQQYDFADLATLPKEFGRGEFTFELWVKPDNRFPVGDTDRGTKDQLTHWSAVEAEPYRHHGWWYPGNWLLDGHTRPSGFDGGDSRAGTFSLQFYGGGRLRWMFADSAADMPKGMVYAVQGKPAPATPSLLDGKWHHVAAVRRWRQPSGATLELWIDGARIGSTDIPLRTNMRQFWDKLPHPNDPPELGGWSFGAEVMTAWDFYFTQYEDYKGWIDELGLWGRALSPAEIAEAAKGVPGEGARDVRVRGLLSRFSFEEGRGGASCDSIEPSRCMTLHRSTAKTWSSDNAPRFQKPDR